MLLTVLLATQILNRQTTYSCARIAMQTFSISIPCKGKRKRKRKEKTKPPNHRRYMPMPCAVLWSRRRKKNRGTQSFKASTSLGSAGRRENTIIVSHLTRFSFIETPGSTVHLLDLDSVDRASPVHVEDWVA